MVYDFLYKYNNITKNHTVNMFETSASHIKVEHLLSTVIIVYIVKIVFWALQFYKSQRKMHRTVANMHTIPSVPILGHIYFLFKTTEEMLIEMCPIVHTYRSPMKVWLGPFLYVCTMKPEHIEVILNHPKTLEKDKFYKLIKSQSTLLCAPVHAWKKGRKLIAPSFNQKILNSFIEIFETNAIGLNNVLESKHPNEEFNVYPFILNSTLPSIIETVFGSSNECENDFSNYCQQYSRYCELIIKRARNLFFYSDLIYKNSKIGKEHRGIAKYLKSFAVQIIQNKLKHFVKNKIINNEKQENKYNDINDTLGTKPKVFIDSLLEESEDGVFRKKELLSISSELILAATNTTAVSSGFVLMMLGMHPEIQDNVYSEINHIFGSSDRNITVEDLSQLHYTEMVIKETMRLFPAVPIIFRKATADVQIEDQYTIPSGSGIFIPIWTIHRNPEVWLDPLTFDPERFSSTNISKRNPYSYIPFSGGSRNCIGYRYAMMLVKTIIATFVRKYKVHCSYKSPADIRLKFAITLQPVEGNLISIEKRNIL